MTARTKDALFALIRNELNHEPLPNAFSLTEVDVREIIQLAKEHDILQLVFDAISRNSLMSKQDALYQSLRNRCAGVVARVMRLEYEQAEITKILETVEIPFVFLKGSMIRTIYAQSWMRTSCDIDILVHEEHLNTAIAALTSNLGYTKRDDIRSDHDISLFSQSGVHLELHYTIAEAMEQLDPMLLQVWDYVEPLENSAFGYQLTTEYFVFYHIAHMAKHVMHGGCGIRPFLDLWVLKNHFNLDTTEENRFIKICGLSKFSNASFGLVEHWMENRPADQTEKDLENFILTGGCYGSLENRVTAQQELRGGRVKYLLSRIFLPYKEIKTLYPILKRYRGLLPFAEVHRWWKLIIQGRVVRLKAEMRIRETDAMGQDESADTLMSRLGLVN